MDMPDTLSLFLHFEADTTGVTWDGSSFQQLKKATEAFLKHCLVERCPARPKTQRVLVSFLLLNKR